MSDPFFYGNPVPVSHFLDREREIRRITGRLVSYGQSLAIVSEPRSGKTSLLFFLSDAENRQSLYGSKTDNLVFSYLDSHTLSNNFSQAEFWKFVLTPLSVQLKSKQYEPALNQAYRTCVNNNFGTFVLECLITQMRDAKLCLVLMLDEFDVLLQHPILNSAEFFGSLRSLTTCSKGALALIIACRHSLTSLNDETSHFSLGGSPYFNFLDEINLSPFSDRVVGDLLSREKVYFTRDDRQFISRVAGGHPFLLQVVASALWQSYQDQVKDPIERRRLAGAKLYDRAAETLNDTWKTWTPSMRKAFTAISLDQIGNLLASHSLDINYLLNDLRDLGIEIRSLSKQGYITPDKTRLSGWSVRSEVFIWWVADQIICTLREDVSYEKWITNQGWEGLLKKGEKQQLDKARGILGSVLKDGVLAFVKGAAEGFGKSLFGGV